MPSASDEPAISDPISWSLPQAIYWILLGVSPASWDAIETVSLNELTSVVRSVVEAVFREHGIDLGQLPDLDLALREAVKRLRNKLGGTSGRTPTAFGIVPGGGGPESIPTAAWMNLKIHDDGSGASFRSRDGVTFIWTDLRFSGDQLKSVFPGPMISLNEVARGRRLLPRCTEARLREAIVAAVIDGTYNSIDPADGNRIKFNKLRTIITGRFSGDCGRAFRRAWSDVRTAYPDFKLGRAGRPNAV